MVTLDDVRAAAVRIRGVAVRTPLLEVGPLALKCENLQPMGAFKVRGACNMIAQLSPAARAAGVITYSSGNHGQAMALVAQRFGIPAVVVMPETCGTDASSTGAAWGAGAGGANVVEPAACV